MGERPKGLGKVAENGTLNENGAFYSVQDINALLENGGGSSGGGDLPTPTVADAGSVVVVDNEGKYALGEAGGENSLHVVMSTNDNIATLDKTYNDIIAAVEASKYVYLTEDAQSEGMTIQFVHTLSGTATNENDYYSAAFKDYTFESASADGVLSMTIISPGN